MLLLLPCVKFEISNQPVCWHLLSLCAAAFDLNMSHFQPVRAALFRLVRAMSVNSSGLGRLLPEVKISECGNLTEEYALVRKALERENQDFIGIKFYECSRPFFYLWSWKLWTKERVLQIFIQLLMQSWQSLISLLMHGEDRCFQVRLSKLASSKMRKLKSLQAPNWQVTSMTIWHDVWPEKMMT